MSESNFFTDFLFGKTDYEKQAKEYVLKKYFTNERKLNFKINALMQILIDKNIITRDEFDNKYYKQTEDYLIKIKEKVKTEIEENKNSEDLFIKESNKLNIAIIEYIDSVFSRAENMEENKQ